MQIDIRNITPNECNENIPTNRSPGMLGSVFLSTTRYQGFESSPRSQTLLLLSKLSLSSNPLCASVHMYAICYNSL